MKATLRNLASTAAQTYIRGAPWTGGKRQAYAALNRLLMWRDMTVVTRTSFGDLMQVKFPDLISSVIYATGQWEPAVTSYVRTALRSGDVFVDVGANIGYFTLLASRLVGESGKVFAIEAAPWIAERLRKNIAMNERGNVRVVQSAVGPTKGELPLYHGGATNEGRTTTVGGKGFAEAGRVPCDTLLACVGDELFSARLLKIDIEGGELGVLTPIFDVLNRFADSTEWIIELTPDGGSATTTICETFWRHGYRSYRLPTEYTMNATLGLTRGTTSPLVEPPTEGTPIDAIFTRRELRMSARSRLD